MQPLFVLVVLLSLLQACTYSQPLGPMSDSPKTSIHSSHPEPLRIASTPESLEVRFNLSDYQWQHRIVLIFAPSERSPAYQQQMQQWTADQDGIRDRDLKLVEVLGTGESRADGRPMQPASAERLRQQFGVGPEDFVVILVGKDGTEKQRSQSPVEPTMLFRTIDAMPMRQQEMRSRRSLE
jgi:hypothetical protein